MPSVAASEIVSMGPAAFGTATTASAEAYVRRKPAGESCHTWVSENSEWFSDATQAEATEPNDWRKMNEFLLTQHIIQAVNTLAKREDKTPSGARVELKGSTDLGQIHSLGYWHGSTIRQTYRQTLHEYAMGKLSPEHRALVEAHYAELRQVAAAGTAEYDEQDAWSINSLGVIKPDGMMAFTTSQNWNHPHPGGVLEFKIWNTWMEREAITNTRGAETAMSAPITQPPAVPPHSTAALPHTSPLHSASHARSSTTSIADRAVAASAASPPSHRRPVSPQSYKALHRHGLCQLAAYLLTSYQFCGTRLGAFIINHRFQRVAVLPYEGRDVIFVEVKATNETADQQPFPWAEAHVGLEAMPNVLSGKEVYSDADFAPGSAYYRMWSCFNLCIDVCGEACSRDQCPKEQVLSPQTEARLKNLFERDTSTQRLAADLVSYANFVLGTETLQNAAKKHLEKLRVIARRRLASQSASIHAGPNRSKRHSDPDHPHGSSVPGESAGKAPPNNAAADANGRNTLAESAAISGEGKSTKRQSQIYPADVSSETTVDWVDSVDSDCRTLTDLHVSLQRDVTPYTDDQGIEGEDDDDFSDLSSEAPSLDDEELEAFIVLSGIPVLGVPPDTMDWMTDAVAMLASDGLRLGTDFEVGNKSDGACP